MERNKKTERSKSLAKHANNYANSKPFFLFFLFIFRPYSVYFHIFFILFCGWFMLLLLFFYFNECSFARGIKLYVVGPFGLFKAHITNGEDHDTFHSSMYAIFRSVAHTFDKVSFKFNHFSFVYSF